jgi:hypothetical protein
MTTGMIIPAAMASSVDVSVVDVTAPTGSVSLAPGGSGAITINMVVTGNQAGTCHFSIYKDWTLSGGAFTGSNIQEFEVPARAAQDAPTTFSTTGTITVASDQPSGGPFTLAVSAFNIYADYQTGGKLADGRDSSYQVTVLAPSDTTPPVITHIISGTEGNNGWYTNDVTVTFTATDAQSTITSQGLTNPITSTANSYTIDYDTTGITITYSATSSGGSSSDSVAIKRDATAPSITGSRLPDANSYGWNNVNVVVHFDASDGTAGLASVTPDTTLSNEGADQFVTGTATDNAGNSATATVENINIDKTNPTIAGSASPTPNANGWNNVDVTVSFTAEDTLSGIATCTTPITLSAEAADQSATGTATDKAGNSATTTVSGINIDKTEPEILISSFENYQVYPKGTKCIFGASDALSGLQSCTGRVSDGFGNSHEVFCEDVLEAGVYTLTVTALDEAGNQAEDTRFFVIYDPSAGFATGGGWIDSPAGAYKADTSLAGKATFGFVSKYQKGANVPTGNTEFQFHAAGLNFKSTSYDWLVVAGTSAIFKGEGTIIGQTGTFKFMLWANDGGAKGADTFRIQITDDSDKSVYDNGVQQTISGSIVVHK